MYRIDSIYSDNGKMSIDGVLFCKEEYHEPRFKPFVNIVDKLGISKVISLKELLSLANSGQIVGAYDFKDVVFCSILSQRSADLWDSIKFIGVGDTAKSTDSDVKSWLERVNHVHASFEDAHIYGESKFLEFASNFNAYLWRGGNESADRGNPIFSNTYVGLMTAENIASDKGSIPNDVIAYALKFRDDIFIKNNLIYMKHSRTVSYRVLYEHYCMFEISKKFLLEVM